jgi:hypothetical protein
MSQSLSLTEIYDLLPLTERVMLKRLRSRQYPFKLRNDTGRVNVYRVIVDGWDLGIIHYHAGRKLVCHGLMTPQREPAE